MASPQSAKMNARFTRWVGGRFAGRTVRRLIGFTGRNQRKKDGWMDSVATALIKASPGSDSVTDGKRKPSGIGGRNACTCMHSVSADGWLIVSYVSCKMFEPENNVLIV